MKTTGRPQVKVGQETFALLEELTVQRALSSSERLKGSQQVPKDRAKA